MPAFYEARRRGLYARVRYSNDKEIYTQREFEREQRKTNAGSPTSNIPRGNIDEGHPCPR